MKKLLFLKIFVSTLILSGCANGTYNTGNKATDAALTAATSTLTGELLNVAAQAAQGSDIKTALINASGDAIRSLESSGVTSVQPAINSTLIQWLPNGVDWTVYSKSVGGIVNDYVLSHGGGSTALNGALEAAATTLNNYQPTAP